MERDKKLRSVTRTRFTKGVNVLDSEISKSNADLGVIKDKFSKLKDIDFKLKDLDQMLDHMMVADAEEDTLNCEIEEAEHYSDTFITLERKVRELIDSDNKSDVKSLGSSNGSLMAKSYKLPKIEIRKFDGELINWLPFWAQFEKIHEDTELHDADKFHYLVQSMQSNTRARELIESYPQTADNYAKAVQALKQRYGQKDLLVEIYVRELLKLMMANVKTPPDERRSVAKLYDKLETQLRSLESLGVDTKENTEWLFPMIESCLPEDVLVAWQRSPLNNCDASKNSNSNSSSRLNNLLDFLRREVEGKERRLLARRGFEGSSPKEKLRNKFKQNTNIPTALQVYFLPRRWDVCSVKIITKPIGNVNIAHSLFGGTQTETKCHKVYTVALCSNLSELNTLREFEFLGQDINCGEIPRTPKGAWLNELKGSRIWLSDLGRDSPKIELLIGSDIYGSLLSGRVKQLENGLTAIETHLGWTICGPSPKKDEQTDYSSLVVISMHSRNMSVDYLWDLETIGIKDPRENLTKLEEDKIIHQHFLNTVHQLKDGRFCVGLPWLGNQEGIPSNRHIAERRLFNTTRKLRAKGIFSEYDRVFQEWLAEGVIEKVSPEDLNRNCHYLPHHPVVKANSNTTKIRPVFDASLKEEDRDHLRFLWWKNNHQIQVFRHKRVVFDVTCSPYLLGKVILHHLKGVSSEFGALPQKLMECLYIDNCVTSVDTEAELVDLVEKSTEIFAKAKMDLRMWQFGPIPRVKEVYSRLPPSVDIERSEEASVLGMKWNLLEDTLNVTPKFGVIINSLSKRDLLSHTQQIFDPIGFLAPVLLPAKLLIQQAWTVKTDWDEPLPSTIQENFMKWYSELDTLADIKIPRRVGHGVRAHWSIHIFCDASQSAYAAAAFLRCPENKGVSVQLLMAKSRLGPLKKTTIPRMELLACMLGVRLGRYIIESLNLAAEPVYYWTDSTTALSWIKTNRQWGTFVNNRVKEICNTSGPNKWFYVPGSLNPADLPSRGCSVLQIKLTRWWEGPEWLKQSQDHWPKQLFHSDRTLVNLEIDRQVLVTTHVRTEVMPWFERFSNFTKIVRINAWIRRMVETRSGKMQDPSQERIQAEESAKPQPGATIGRDASSDPVVLNPNIDIPKYDGTEDPRPWIESLEEIGFLYHWADYIISRYAAMNMTGSAKTWLNLHKASFTSWENIKIRLIQDFSLDANKEELRMKLNRMQHWNEPAISVAPESVNQSKSTINGIKKLDPKYKLKINVDKIGTFEALVDTGADLSVVDLRTALDTGHGISKLAKICAGPDGKKLDMVGSIFLNIKIDDETLSHNFVILKTHLRTLILGRDFLKKMNAKIDCKQETIKYDLTNNHDEINFEMLKIKSAKDSIVPECSMKLIKALVETEDGEYIIEESSKMFQTNGLRLARSLINVINRETHIWITNPYPRPLKIMKNQTLAFGSSPAKINVSREREIEKNEEPRFQINENLSPKEQKELKQVLERYGDLFSSRLGRTNLSKHRIDTEDAKPIKHKPYRVSAKERDIIKEQIDEMLTEGIIRPSSSPWSFPVILDKKRDERQEEAFQTLKTALLSPPILGHFNPNAPTYVHTDVSNIGIGATLVQDIGGEEKVISYLSRTLSKAEQNYSTTEKECLAVVWSMSKLRPYLYGRHFKIVTDHHALCWLKNLKDPTGRLARWALKIQEYDFDIIHKSGKKHLDADGLSRGPLPETDWDEDFERLFLNQITDEEDKFIESVKKNLNGSRRSIAQNFKEEDGCLFKKNPNPEGRAWLLVVPENKKREIMKEYHNHMSNGHLGVARTMMVETRSGKMQDPSQERIQAEESAKPQPGATIRNTQELSPSGMHSLQLSELEDADRGIWKTVQQQVFSSRGDSINGLMIIRDDFGLIRIKSKLIERDDEYSFRYPILLPTKHHVVTCLIREFHLRHCHAGVQILSAKLRENYWILNSQRSIRSVVSQCAKCRRFSSKPVKTAPIHLPLDRVRDATAFEILGVDLAGPLYLKNKTKAWIVLFTCAVFRAIHLELVTSLSTEAFIQALRRFIAWRGRPTVIYSDNGTNFVGANNALKALNWKKIVLDQNLHKISWKFIPPTAAWWGGWWERLIRSIKDLLVRILGHSSVYYEEMSTILCDAEATINSRPLTYIHEDFDSLIPLSPSMFLHDSKYVGVPDLDKLDSKKFQDRYRHCQRLREALRSRFRSEYLGQLVQKANERTPKLSVGDVVIVKVEDKRRLHWPMARIVELFPGRDGHSRVAKVRTKLGTLIRPVQKLYPLEVSSGDPILRSKGDTTIEEAHSEAKRTRCGRV
ncbi:hypothetical protein LAZ67_4003814, partial [Cordylochernes scorpioides]